MTTEIIRLLNTLSSGLKAKQLINQFAYGSFGDFDRVLNRTYPLMYVEYPTSYGRVVGTQIDKYQVGITLLDQPKSVGEHATDRDLAALKTRLELSWAVFWNACKLHNQSDIPTLTTGRVYVNVGEGYNAIEVDLTQGDGVYGYRYEIAVHAGLSGCDLEQLMDTITNLCLPQ